MRVLKCPQSTGRFLWNQLFLVNNKEIISFTCAKVNVFSNSV